jgi:hypothetical protein
MAKSSWTADVEVLVDTEPSADELERWMAVLADHSPDFAASELAAGVDGVLITGTLTIEAESLVQATAEALRMVEETTGGRADGVMVFEADEYEARVERPFVHKAPTHTLTGYGEIADIAGV